MERAWNRRALGTDALSPALTRRATQALGREAIDQLNATGGGGAPGPSGATFVNVLNGRVISRSVEAEAQRSTALFDALGLRGGPVGVQDVFGMG